MHHVYEIGGGFVAGAVLTAFFGRKLLNALEVELGAARAEIARLKVRVAGKLK